MNAYIGTQFSLYRKRPSKYCLINVSMKTQSHCINMTRNQYIPPTLLQNVAVKYNSRKVINIPLTIALVGAYEYQKHLKTFGSHKYLMMYLISWLLYSILCCILHKFKS